MSQPEKKHILITGGSGFIGSHMVVHLTKTHPEYVIVNLDKMSYASSKYVTKEVHSLPNYSFVKGDILNTDLLMLILTQYKIDHVIHFASETHVDNSFAHSLEFTKNNVLGTHVLIETCRQYGNIKKFIHISTDEVYGESAYGGHGATSSSLLLPTNPYSASKAAAEHIVLGYMKSFNFPAVITRSNNIFGPHQFPEKVIPKWCCLLEKGLKIPVHGNGTQTRAFLYVSDVVNAYELVLERGTIGNIYNISSDIELTNKELAKVMVNIWGRDEESAIEYVRDRNVNDERYHINDEKIRALGWTPIVSFDEGLKKTIEWYKANDPSLVWENYTPKFLDAHPSLPKI